MSDFGNRWKVCLTGDGFDGNDVRLLGEIGYAAANRGLHRDAERVFAAMAAVRPGSAAAGIGRALMALSLGRFDEAARLVERDALAADPASLEAHELLVLALELAGRAAARERVQVTLARLRCERESDAVDAART
jgi:thioredoxin-like negative regulator of GroEL